MVVNERGQVREWISEPKENLPYSTTLPSDLGTWKDAFHQNHVWENSVITR